MAALNEGDRVRHKASKEEGIVREIRVVISVDFDEEFEVSTDEIERVNEGGLGFDVDVEEAKDGRN